MKLALTEAVKALIRGLGFDACGIAAAHPLTEAYAHTPTYAAYQRYRAWIEAGHQAGMRYLADTLPLRQDPTRFLEGAQSIVLVLQSYFQARQARPPLAQYAWGPDYHTHLWRRLQILADYLERKGFAARPFVDTAPILEKAWAVEAGLGWIGKNTLLLHRRLGSYTFIGGVLTTAPLLPDPPYHQDLCGTCNRCIEACPTGALSPYRLDARRCIAYWTIEARELSVEAPPLGEWLFGCDLCQAVCPWNRFARPQGEFVPAAHAFWSRERWATVSRSEVRRLQRGSALRRARPEKILTLAKQAPSPHRSGSMKG